jgi:putative aldouronate transport system substrate-binding protein
MAARFTRRTFAAAVPGGIAALGGLGAAQAAPGQNPHPAFLAQDATPAGPQTIEEFLTPVSGKYDPAIELTTVGIAWPTIVYPEGDDINNNVWKRAYQSKYGITVTNEWAVPSDQYEQRVNLMLSSGDLPDYFQASPTQFKQLADEDRIMDVTDVYNNATDRVKNAVTEGGPVPLDSATIDGRIMAIPHSTVAREGASVLWVRKDWLEAVGMEPPTTIDELLAVAEAFVSQDVNGQGNAVGLGLDNQLDYASGFFAGHGAYRGIWLDDGSGALAYSSIQPPVKEALGKLQALYAAGQIDLEFGTKNGEALWEDMAAGRIGMYYGSGYDGPIPLGNVKLNFPDSDWYSLPIPSVTADPAKPMVSLGIAGYWVVNTECQNPEALPTLIDFWVQAFYDSTLDEVYDTFNQGPNNNSLWRMNSAQVVKPYKNLNVAKAITAILESGSTDTSTLNAEGRGYYELITSWLNDGNLEGWGWNAIYGPGGAMVEVIDSYVQNDQFVQSAFYGAPTPAMVSRQSTLDTQEIETFTRII